MAGRDYPNSSRKAAGERSIEDIEKDIAKGEENISHTVEQIGERIKEKLDWRGYVKDAPYASLGVAAGLGYLASVLLISRETRMERIMHAIGDEIRDTCGSVMGGNAKHNFITASILGVVSKAAADWAKKAAFSNGRSNDDRRQLPNQRSAAVGGREPAWEPKTETDTQIII